MGESHKLQEEPVKSSALIVTSPKSAPMTNDHLRENLSKVYSISNVKFHVFNKYLFFKG